MKNKLVILLSVFLNFVFLTGCNIDATNQHENKDYMALLKATHPAPTIIGKENVSAEDIKKDVEKMEYIYDVAVIKGEHEDLVVYKVKHLQRFKMKKIEKEITTMLEKKYPKENFVVSSDYKIFLEAVRLGKKMEDPNYTKKRAQKRLEEIIKLKKELT